MVEVDLVDAGRPQGVALQVQRLGAVGLRDAGVADQHVSQTLPSWFVLHRRTVTSTPSPSAASATSAQAPRAHLAPPHPRHEEESRDHGVEATPLEPPTRPLGGQRGHPVRLYVERR